MLDDYLRGTPHDPDPAVGNPSQVELPKGGAWGGHDADGRRDPDLAHAQYGGPTIGEIEARLAPDRGAMFNAAMMLGEQVDAMSGLLEVVTAPAERRAIATARSLATRLYDALAPCVGLNDNELLNGTHSEVRPAREMVTFFADPANAEYIAARYGDARILGGITRACAVVVQEIDHQMSRQARQQALGFGPDEWVFGAS